MPRRARHAPWRAGASDTSGGGSADTGCGALFLFLYYTTMVRILLSPRCLVKDGDGQKQPNMFARNTDAMAAILFYSLSLKTRSAARRRARVVTATDKQDANGGLPYPHRLFASSYVVHPSSASASWHRAAGNVALALTYIWRVEHRACLCHFQQANWDAK